ncbi:MAG TPA: hypothetical protein VN898_02840 [Candidatus Binatia bacterium]|nr:hypothetical protein [Candidatus Binatia bacterium]
MKRWSALGPLVLIPASLVLGAVGCSSSEQTASQPPASALPGGVVADTKPVPEARWIDATVPSGTPIKLSLIDTLSPETSKQGDPFRTLVTDAVLVNGTVVVPSGSNILGRVGEVTATSLKLQFERVDTPTGASAPLKARLADAKPGGPDKRALMSTAPIVVVLEEPLLIKVKQ